ncbi:MAG: RAD55 family ATPase, partial [Candidatus Syntropharchaeia archaeon]
MPEKIERIKTYVEGLDDKMEGGIPKRTVTLICGTPGCMKSSLAYSILYHNARENGSKGVFITLEQDIRSLLQHMSKLNMGGDKNLLVVDYDGVESRIKEDRMFERNWIKRVANYARDLKEKE